MVLVPYPGWKSLKLSSATKEGPDYVYAVQATANNLDLEDVAIYYL